MRGINKSEGEVLVRLKPGDRFADEDIYAVNNRVKNLSDQRLAQHVMLRPLDGFAIDTRVLTATQVLRLAERSRANAGECARAAFIGRGWRRARRGAKSVSAKRLGGNVLQLLASQKLCKFVKSVL